MLSLSRTGRVGLLLAGTALAARPFTQRCCGGEDHSRASSAAAPAPAPAPAPASSGTTSFARAYDGTLRALELIAPIQLAEGWDNVGMLIDRLPRDDDAQKQLVVFITNGAQRVLTSHVLVLGPAGPPRTSHALTHILPPPPPGRPRQI